MFSLPPAEFRAEDLDKLATAMKGDDAVKDGADPEESHIPAAYTYFGQFVDHDLTFDPSTFQQQKHDPNGIVDFRTPRFDLDNLYGRGPADQPFLYDGSKLLLGEKLLTVERNPDALDLPRAAASSVGVRRAIIGDPRNDENVIVSQFHGMMMRFHNRVVDKNPNASFDAIQQIVRWHYQWIMVHDFLPRIVEQSVLDAVSPAIVDTTKDFRTAPPTLKFYTSKETVMPVEFSVAAYRLGHSMVRPAYRVNEFTSPLRIFDAQNPSNGLNAFGEFPKSWGIDWQRFVDLGLRSGAERDTDRVQAAYKLDTSIVEPLSELPASVTGDIGGDKRLLSLAYRNLLRGAILRLPSGQDVAKKMGVPPLADADILVGAAEDGSKPGDAGVAITTVSPAFAGHCPLWTYALAESRRNFYEGAAKKAQLGAVGGRIVAEVFLGLLLRDTTSFAAMQPDWKPTLGTGGQMTLADLLRVGLVG